MPSEGANDPVPYISADVAMPPLVGDVDDPADLEAVYCAGRHAGGLGQFHDRDPCQRPSGGELATIEATHGTLPKLRTMPNYIP